MRRLKISRKEAAKVAHEINSVWHIKYKDVKKAYIYSHSNRPDSPSYVYTFINHGFDNYEFTGKYPTSDRR